MVPVMAQMLDTLPARKCQVCGAPLLRPRQRWYCSEACQMVAFRRRRAHDRDQTAFTAGRLEPARHSQIVYECDRCGARYLAEQRCPDCNTFCRRLGPGGPCLHCDELVTVAELLT